jgi:hypothetical protein
VEGRVVWVEWRGKLKREKKVEDNDSEKCNVT